MVHAARVAGISSSVIMTREDSDDDPGSGVQRVQYLRPDPNTFGIGVRNRVRSKLKHAQH